MRPRIPVAALLAAALAAACASAPRGTPRGFATPRLHHLLDLEDARAPLREYEPFLRDADPEVRARAALAVGRKGGEGAAAQLRLAARDPEARVREATAFAMGIAGDPDLAGDALAMMQRAGATTGETAAAASAAVRAGGERVWKEEAFTSLLAHALPEVRRAACRALAGAVRGWKEKPDRESKFAETLILRVIGKDVAPDERVSLAIVLRSLAPKAPGTAPMAGDAPALGGVAVTQREWIQALNRGAREILAGAYPDVRAALGQAFMTLESGPEAPALARLLGQGETVARVRVAFLRGLAKEKSPEGTTLLADALLEDPDFGVRATAAEMLGLRGEAARGAVPGLAMASAEDGSRLVRVGSVLALQAIGGDRARAAVLGAAKSDDPFLRAAAAGTLLTLDELAPLVRDPEIRVREAAVDEAGKRGRPALDLCLDALRDPDPVVAAMAAGALGGMGATEARGAIEEVLRKHPVPSKAPDDWADLRASAVEALGKLKAECARAMAEAHLADPDPTVRMMAAGVLEKLDGKRPEIPIPARLLPFVAPGELRVSDEGAPRVRFTTDKGRFVVQTLPSAAPVHVARFLQRVREGGYDGTLFHRIVPAFVAQGGDPRGDGSGSGGASTREEFSGVPYDRGVLGVPRSDHPDSGGCQLFFCHGMTPHLDQRYTVTGRIVEGVEVIDLLDLGDRILSASIE